MSNRADVFKSEAFLIIEVVQHVGVYTVAGARIGPSPLAGARVHVDPTAPRIQRVGDVLNVLSAEGLQGLRDHLHALFPGVSRLFCIHQSDIVIPVTIVVVSEHTLANLVVLVKRRCVGPSRRDEIDIDFFGDEGVVQSMLERIVILPSLGQVDILLDIARH